MNATGTAFFIEPTGSLRESLRILKAELESELPGQPYTSHPPHCTLLFGHYGKSTLWLETLRQAFTTTPAFELETDRWQLFTHDALAGGGQTVALRVHLSPALLRLQRAIAECVAPHCEQPGTFHPLAERQPFASSLQRYGFPFVGDHWIPHFTIGSPKVSPEDPLLAKLMRGDPRHRFEVHAVSIWNVAGDRHDRQHELALADDKSMTPRDAETS